MPLTSVSWPLLPAFPSRVIGWQKEHGRHDLPWQNTRDPYRIWLSEIMLQQTKVTTVLPYYLRFLDSFPDVASLARAPLDAVLARWSGLGYYRRAHHLHAAAQAVMEAHGGVFPRDAATLETLPGIGRSTAAAIAAFSSGACVAILDGNVKRVLARHAGIEGWPGAPKVEAALWEIAQLRLPRDPGDGDVEAYTQGMMDLGATVCTRTQPRCFACPVAADCVARLEGRTDALPSPRPAKAVPHRDVRVLVLERDGCVLFERRPLQGIWAGLWSLPECALDDDARAVALSRFGFVVDAAQALPPLEHGFTHFTLTMHPVRLAARDEHAGGEGSRAAPRIEMLRNVGQAGVGRRADVGQGDVEERNVGLRDAASIAAPRSHSLYVAERDQVAWLSHDAAEAAGLPAPIRRLVRSLDLAGFRLA